MNLTLSVPADPAAVRVVRAVLRGWGATAGLSLDEIDALCRTTGHTFLQLLARRPRPERIVMRTPSGVGGVDLLAVRDEA